MKKKTKARNLSLSIITVFGLNDPLINIVMASAQSINYTLVSALYFAKVMVNLSILTETQHRGPSKKVGGEVKKK